MKAKEQFLINTGFKDENVSDYSLTPDSFMCLSLRDGEYIIYNFEGVETKDQFWKEVIQISCCGDELDKDIMICPSCKEHC